MEPKDLINLYLRWFWLLLAGVILGVSGGFFASRIQRPVYEASTKVLITRNRPQTGTDILSISDQQLVLTYQQLLKTRPLLHEVASRLDTNVDSDSIRADIIPNTQIIQIKVQNQDRELAAAVANTLVQILIEQNETLQAGRYSLYEESLNSQISQVQEQIADLQNQLTQINQANIEKQLTLVRREITDLEDKISKLEQEIADFPVILSTVSRASLTEKQTQLNQFRSLLSLYQEIETNLTFIGEPIRGVSGSGDPRATNLQITLGLYQQLYLNLLNNLETVKLARVQSTPIVSQIEEANIPARPIRPIPLLYTVLSGMLGLLFAAGAVLLIDYFDDTLKSAQKIQELLGVPVIGQITIANGRIKNNVGSPYVFDQAGSMVLNAFETLRVNIGRLAEHKSMKTILITSPGSGEGKTTISLNLAAAFVRAGKKVVLLDADFYHPMMHSRLGLKNGKGLSDILASGLEWQAMVRDFGGIQIITSGAHTASSIRLLESKAMSQLLEKLHKKADLVILDGPPLFMADSQILASKVGGILLVIRPGSTLTASARAVLNQLKFMEANVLGVVLNGIPKGESYYSSRYYRVTDEKSPEEKEETIQNPDTIDEHQSQPTHIS